MIINIVMHRKIGIAAKINYRGEFKREHRAGYANLRASPKVFTPIFKVRKGEIMTIDLFATVLLPIFLVSFGVITILILLGERIVEHRDNAAALVVIGTFAQNIGFYLPKILNGFPTIDKILQILVTGGGVLAFVFGCGYYAKSKGYKSSWGLLGLLSVIGLFILFLLPDKQTSTASTTQSTLRKIASLLSIILGVYIVFAAPLLTPNFYLINAWVSKIFVSIIYLLIIGFGISVGLIGSRVVLQWQEGTVAGVILILCGVFKFAYGFLAPLEISFIILGIGLCCMTKERHIALKSIGGHN